MRVHILNAEKEIDNYKKTSNLNHNITGANKIVVFFQCTYKVKN